MPEETFKTKEEAAESYKQKLIKGYTKIIEGVADKDFDEIHKQMGATELVGKSRQELIQFVIDEVAKKRLTDVFFMLGKMEKKYPQWF